MQIKLTGVHRVAYKMGIFFNGTGRCLKGEEIVPEMHQ
jgi:hypothetical protein